MNTENIVVADRTHEVRLYPKAGLFVWRGAFSDQKLPREAGFAWNALHQVWATASPAIAYRLAPCLPVLSEFRRRLAMSWAEDTDFEVPCPAGLEYHPYQRAGVEYLADLPSSYLCDDMGLGKTPQFIALANLKRAQTVLIGCPAHLRINWAREIEMWSVEEPAVHVVRSRRALVDGLPRVSGRPNWVVASFEVMTKCRELLRAYGPFDLLGIDEAHGLKEHTSVRAKAVLGTKFQEPLTTATRQVVFMSGTPAPNRASELWTILRATAPHIIADCRSYEAFVSRFSHYFFDGDGYVVRGSQNEGELGLRLRGGFMVRRLKSDVLKQLPPKRFEMVVFPAEGQTKRLLAKEKPFNAAEIIRNGVPKGSPLAELRREMGEAKLPVCLEHLSGMLRSGLRKLVVFAHHRSVVQGLHEGLRQFGSRMVIGGMGDVARQAAVDSFHNDPQTRVMVANIEAGGTGLDMTVADTLVRVEGSWVPGENVQVEDRIYRHGQKAAGVRIIDLVVEGSLDAMILGCAARKSSSISSALDVRF